MSSNFEKLKNDYITELRKLKKVSDTTISIYEKEIVEFINYLKKENGLEVSFLKIDLYIKKMKENYSVISVKRKIASLNGFYKYLQKKGYLENNPFFGIKFITEKPLAETEENFIDEFEKIKNNCEDTPKGIRDKLFITLLMKKNIKINDIINIEIKDIIKKNEIWSLRKTEIKVISLEQEEVILLEKYLEVRPLILEEYEEKLFKGLTRQSFRVKFQNYCKKLGLKEISPSQIKKSIQKSTAQEFIKKVEQRYEKIREVYMKIKIGDE